MEKLKDKKVSFLLILFSVLMLIFGVITKDYNGTYEKLKYSGYKKPPLKLYEVDVFGMSFDYVNFLLFFIITFGIGIYFLIYKNDNTLKNAIKKPAFIEKVKIKYSEFEQKSLPKENKIETTELNEKKNVPTVISLITLFALFFTFYMATKMGFSLWFFIILSYFYLITLTPKTKKEIIIKSIGYPLIFLIVFAISESTNTETIYGIEIERPFTYHLSKHFIPFLISVIIIYISQIRRFGKSPKFNIKSPLFWISSLCLVISIVRFGIEKYIENN